MAANGSSKPSRHRSVNRKSILFGGSVGIVQAFDGQNAAKVYEGSEVDCRPHLVVIGGGFAGLFACRKMRHEFKVTLIDAKEYFEFYPGICRAYVHPREHRKLARHYQPICDGLAVNFCWGEVLGVNVDEKTVNVEEMSSDQCNTLKYDYLLVTAGSQYGINLVCAKRDSHGQECLWYPTFLDKGIKDSAWQGLDERFLSGRRRHLEREYEVLKKLHDTKATILIIGAGFVGIEYATEVKFYFPDIDVVIVEQRDCAVGVMPESCIKYCQDYMDRVGIKTLYGKKYTEFMDSGSVRKIETSENDHVSALEETVNKLGVWSKQWGISEPARVYMAVGLRPINQFLPAECLTPGKRGGWIQTNEHQQVLRNGEPLPNVFAAGNCCEIASLRLPKNSFPAEDMAAVACHNIRVTRGRANPRAAGGGCFGFLRPRKFKEMHWGWGTGLCATSLGPHDATLVAGSTEKSGSGYTVLKGYLSALNKEFIRWSKVDQVAGGCIGTLVWELIH